MKDEVVMVLPPRADVDNELVKLTKYLVKNLNLETSYGLGGEYGYGVKFENDTFMMNPFCWCDKDTECLWCMDNDPTENPRYKELAKELQEKFGDFAVKYGGAPNFYFKPTKAGIYWYKWIGRGEQRFGDLPKDWYDKCIKSIKSRDEE